LPLKKGEPASKPYQLLCDSLVDGSLFKNQSTVNELKTGVRICPMTGNQVSVSSVCSRCYKKSPDVWMKCSAMLVDQGILPEGTIPKAQKGKQYKGAIR